MALGSLGSDTRASIRVPAALSGVVGFRPSTGLVPVDGWLTLSWSLDVLAPMARSVRDVALLMDVLTASGSRFRDAIPGSLAGLKVGFSDVLGAGSEPGVRACFEGALDAAQRAGAEVVRCHGLTGEDVQMANYTGMVLSRVEAAQFHADAGTDLDRCTPEVRMQLDQAGEVAAVDYVRCLRIRERLYERFLNAFSGIDLLIMPTSCVVAPPIAEAERYLLLLSETCIPWSLVGFPAISLFAGMSGGLPTGVQLVAPAGQDAFLLAAAHALERQLPPIPEWLE
jgi:aspartyl-tRNA(Asn)/glutamyl-tRNA(Gln) amidotransferase subunit A